MATVVVVVVGNAAFSLRQATIGFTGAEMAEITAGLSTYGVGDTIRTMGLLPTNQDFGLLAACLTPALFMSAAHTKGWYRTWLLVAGVALAAAMALSLTRTSLIAAVAALVIALALWGNGDLVKRLAKYGSIAAVSTVALILMVQASGNERVITAVDRALTLTDLTGDRSFNDRLAIVYPRAIQAMIENPFGAGSGSAGPMSQIRPDIAPLGELTTDNGFLMIGVQLGWIGMVVFFALLVSAMAWLVKKDTFYAISAATAILALMIAMITAQYWTLTAPVCVIAAWVGLGVSSTSKTADPTLLVKPREKLLVIK
ncbi:O-antigen ligase family protein [Arthrobacter alpinus]|uniref:O-antigen ligase family protein n=1 Tax=Arthrobacter alpinus TaxID=656366 RepID=UPI001479F8F7|nr:O-antigen ligase family protein [Arthrobacter alpinus]